MGALNLAAVAGATINQLHDKETLRDASDLRGSRDGECATWSKCNGDGSHQQRLLLIVYKPHTAPELHFRMRSPMSEIDSTQ